MLNAVEPKYLAALLRWCVGVEPSLRDHVQPGQRAAIEQPHNGPKHRIDEQHKRARSRCGNGAHRGESADVLDVVDDLPIPGTHDESDRITRRHEADQTTPFSAAAYG